jgi:hypothetical protein
VDELRGVMSARFSVVLLVTAVLAALAACSALWIGEARASTGSGGVTTDGGESTDASSGSGGLPTGGGESTDDSAQASRYEGLWAKLSRQDRRWARSTAACESGGDPDAIGGGGAYRGAFQFTISTWRRAPKSPGGDPIDYPYKTQAVVAVALKRRDGTGHWPNCG